MAYKKFDMTELPPHLIKNKDFTYQHINSLIDEAFKRTKLKRTVVCTNAQQNQTRIYLESSNVSAVHSVKIDNRKGAELNYTIYTQTGSYANYIDIDRPLEIGESLHIEFSVKPTNNDLLKNGMDIIYIRDEAYETLIDMLHGLCQVCDDYKKNKKENN